MSPSAQDIYSDYPQGYYADGAYTATPLSSSNTPRRRSRDESEASDLDPQDAYYTALSTRFATLRSHLRSPPPLPANGVLTIPVGFNTRKEWRNKILRTAPKMGVLALLQHEMVIKSLEVLEDLLTAGNLRGEVGKNVGAWAWGLLARCRELGTMGSEEVGVVRRVGRRGVQLLRRMRAGSVVEELGGVGEEEGEGNENSVGVEDDTDVYVAQMKEGEEEDEGHIESIATVDPVTSVTEGSGHLLSPPAEEGLDGALAEARARILASLGSADEKHAEVNKDAEHQQQQQNPISMGKLRREGVIDREAIHATLDMIVTIVGEFYGQRDLLDGRLLWDEMA